MNDYEQNIIKLKNINRMMMWVQC